MSSVSLSASTSSPLASSPRRPSPTRYPRSIFFILGNEFCERFSFYGMRTLLTIYFVTQHHMDEKKAVSVYHGWNSLVYATPLLGSILADSYFGRFKVILYLSVVYVVGHAMLSVGAIPQLSLSIKSFMDYAGLIVIAFGTGGIKPCVSAFAADQFTESQKEERSQFFSFFYFAINAGSLLAIITTPIFKNDVKCFGEDHCFPLAFGVPGLLMLLALVIFIAGCSKYKKMPPSKENVAWQVVSCVATAAGRKLRGKEREGAKSPERWLQRAAPDFSPEMISSVQSFLDVSIVFFPLILFWALFEQQGSTWVLQARRMNCRFGSLTMASEQMQLWNPLLVLVFVPLLEGVIYPGAKKLFRVTPLRKMAAGGILAGLSFMVAGLLQIAINPSMSPPPLAGEVFVWTVGGADLSHSTKLAGEDFYRVPPSVLDVSGSPVDLSPHGGLGVFLSPSSSIAIPVDKPGVEKRIYFLVSPSSPLHGGEATLYDGRGEALSTLSLVSSSSHFIKLTVSTLDAGVFTLRYGNNCSGVCPHSMEVPYEQSCVYVAWLEGEKLLLIPAVKPNSVSIAWTIPQYLLITLGECLLSVTGLEFAYSQSAPNMKSVLQAMWLMMIFLGDTVAMLFSITRIVPRPAEEFFFYGGLMLGVMAVFVLLGFLLALFPLHLFPPLATRYEYKDVGESGEGEAAPSSHSDTPL